MGYIEDIAEEFVSGINKFGYPQVYRTEHKRKHAVCPICYVPVEENKGQGPECDSCRNDTVI